MRNVLVALLFLCSVGVSAQINITPYIPDDISRAYPDAANVLESKLNNILAANDISTTMQSPRFVLTGNWVDETKDVVRGTPPQIAYTLNVNLFIGDCETGTKYASETFRVKGVGATEEKAHLAAIKNLQVKSSQMSDFVKKGKERIVGYYEDNRDKIFSQINTLIAKHDYEEAAYQLCLIPMECSYYSTAQSKICDVYPLIIDNQANALFTEAKSIWASNQTESGASQVMSLVAQINPNASCYSEVQSFIEKVTAKVNLINEREYAAYQQRLAHQREMEKQSLAHQQEMEKREMASRERLQSQRIAAVRDIAVAYAKRRTNVYVLKKYYWY